MGRAEKNSGRDRLMGAHSNLTHTKRKILDEQGKDGIIKGKKRCLSNKKETGNEEPSGTLRAGRKSPESLVNQCHRGAVKGKKRGLESFQQSKEKLQKEGRI